MAITRSTAPRKAAMRMRKRREWTMLRNFPTNWNRTKRYNRAFFRAKTSASFLADDIHPVGRAFRNLVAERPDLDPGAAHALIDQEGAHGQGARQRQAA